MCQRRPVDLLVLCLPHPGFEVKQLNVFQGLNSVLTRLQKVPDQLMKMDLQNVLYRYFAESARCFKKIQHSIRSGEAELTVISDGEEPEPDALKAAFDEYLVAAFQDFPETVKAFWIWRANERCAVEKRLQEATRPTPVWKLCLCCLFGGVVGYFSSWASKLPLLLMVAGTAAGAVIMALIGHCLGRMRHSRTFRGLLDAWQKMGDFESQLCSFLESLPQEVQSQSFREALASAQAARGQLDFDFRSFYQGP